MLTANDVARYFLAITDEDAGEYISHLKMQKLCYYAQGFSLAINRAPMFLEEIEAWQHGPVVPELWQKYQRHGPSFIPRPDDVDIDLYNAGTRELLDEVYEVYGQFSAWKLRNMTHDEPPWAEAWARGPNTTISHESMKVYFDTLCI